MDWEKLEQECIQIVQDSLKEILAEKEIYTAALYTDNSAGSISFGANTIKNFKAKIIEEDAITKEDIAYYQWAPDEWDLEGYNIERSREINKQLFNSIMHEKKDFDLFFEKTTNLMIECLKKVKDQLGSELKDTILFVTVTDDDFAEELENKSAQCINHPEVAKIFMGRYD